MSQITYYTEIHDRDFSFETTSFVSTSNDSMIHIDRMFQFEQCKSKHDSICKSLKYAFVMFDSKLISAMIDYDDFEEETSIHREVNKINFVTLFHENSDDSAMLFNVMKARKRQKKNSNNSDTEKNIQQKRIVDSSVDKFKKKKVKQKKIKKVMKSISKMKERFEINVKKLLMNNTFTLSIMHLYQISFHFRDEIRRLIIAIRKSRTKKEKTVQIANAQAINANFIAIDENKNIKWITKNYLRIINESFNVFYVFISCNKFDKKTFQIIEISFDLIKIDQKSNLIIINQKLTNDFDLKMYSIIKIDSRNIRMIVINDNHHKFHFFVIFHVHVEKINRKIWAFVNSNHNEIQLLLNFSWLNSISTMMNIQKKIIIDDTAQNESTKLVSASKLIEKHMKNFSNNAKKRHYKTIKKKIIKSTKKRLKSTMRRALNMNIDKKLNSNDEYDVSNSNTKKKIIESNNYESFQ